MANHASTKTRSGQSNLARHGYVYLTTFTRPTDFEKFYYVGQHLSSTLDRKYFGSGTLLRKKITKYGSKGNINVRLLHWTYTQEELNVLEFMCIQIARILYASRCLNLNDGGIAGTGKHSDSTRKKMSITRTGVPLGPSPLRGRTISEAQRANIKAAHNRFDVMLRKSIASKGVPRPAVSIALKGVSKALVRCPNCGTEGGKPAMSRWHGLKGELCS